MKLKHIYITFFLISSIKGFCQTFISENFIYNNTQINYYYNKIKNENKRNFYIIINNKEPKEKITECLKNSNKLKAKIFFFTIPSEIINQTDKENLILEFITEVLKRKLVDYKMNIISDFDYFNKYKETRKINNNRYKYTYLNPINNLYILKINDKICDKIE